MHSLVSPGSLHKDKCPCLCKGHCHGAVGSSWSRLRSQEANCSQAGSRRLVFVELVRTDIFTLCFRAKCQVKREKKSDSSARHLRAGSPAIAPCLTGAQWATFFFLFPLI